MYFKLNVLKMTKFKVAKHREVEVRIVAFPPGTLFMKGLFVCQVKKFLYFGLITSSEENTDEQQIIVFSFPTECQCRTFALSTPFFFSIFFVFAFCPFENNSLDESSK